MRRAVLASVPLLLLLAGVAVAAPEGGPKAVVPEPVRDFETVARGEKLIHEFTIRNDGTAPLEIADVRPACGCTVASFDKTIAPGATGTVHAEVDTASFAGPIAKSVAVFTNDPAQPKLQLVIKAKVQPYIDAAPGYARFIYVQGEPILPITQTITATDGAPFQIVDVKSPYDYLHVTQRQVTSADGKPGYAVDVIIEADSPIGALRDHVEITLDHPKQKVVQIPISGFVRPRQHATPKEVEFGELDQAALPQRRVIAFTHFATEGIEIKGIESNVEGLVGRLESANENGHRFKLLLELGDGIEPGPFMGEVVIHTTDEQQPIYKLPVSGTVL